MKMKGQFELYDQLMEACWDTGGHLETIHDVAPLFEEEEDDGPDEDCVTEEQYIRMKKCNVHFRKQVG